MNRESFHLAPVGTARSGTKLKWRRTRQFWSMKSVDKMTRSRAVSHIAVVVGYATIVAVASTVSPRPLNSQSSPTASDSAPTCVQSFDLMKQRREANYGGYVLEVQGAKQQRYDADVWKLRTSAGRDSPIPLEKLNAG